MDTAFFIASKIVWLAIKPESWIAACLLLAAFGLWRNRLRLARWTTGLALALVLGIGLLPLGDLAIRPLEQRFSPAPALPGPVSGIVVLGGAERAGLTAATGLPQLNEGGERLSEAAALARRHPDARILYTGGSGRLRDLGQISDAQIDVARAFFTAQGIAEERLLFEGASRNTAENAALSLAMADPQPGETWLLLTSAFHMPRSMASFKRAGWPAMTAWPVDHRAEPGRWLSWDFSRNLDLLTTALREHIGRVAYALTGR